MRTRPRFAYSVPKIGKGSFSPLGSVPRLLSGRVAPTSHQASGLRFAPVPCCKVFLMYTPNTNFVHKRSDMGILPSASLALSGWGYADFHGAVNFALTEFDGVHPVSKRSHLAYKLAHLT
jgi:hypothetical protein